MKVFRGVVYLPSSSLSLQQHHDIDNADDDNLVPNIQKYIHKFISHTQRYQESQRVTQTGIHTQRYTWSHRGIVAHTEA